MNIHLFLFKNDAMSVSPYQEMLAFNCLTPIIHRIFSAVERIFHFFNQMLFPSKPLSRHYYFAYGSNLSIGRLQERVGKVMHCGLATLEGYRFSFNKKGSDGTGKANIMPDDSSTVEGAIYQLTEEQLNQLDRYEGAPKHYQRKNVFLTFPSGQKVEAITYVAQNHFISPRPLRPSVEYLNHIFNGARENHLSSAMVQKIQHAASGT
jgi:gamma-glutamylcyclotransferase